MEISQQQQQAQKRHDIELQLVQERYKEEKAERNRIIKIAEEQRREENILQQRRFNAEQVQVQNQISDDRFDRDKGLEATTARTE